MSDPHPIIATLFAEVKSRKMGRKILAWKTGMAESHLSRYKSGQHCPDIRRVEILAESLGFRLVLQPIGESDDARAAS